MNDNPTIHAKRKTTFFKLTQSPSQTKIFQYLEMYQCPNNFEATCCDSCLLCLTAQCNEYAYKMSLFSHIIQLYKRCSAIAERLRDIQ